MMKYLGKAATVFIIISISAIALAGPGDFAKSGSWERKITVKNTNASSVNTIKTYWEGNRKRTETYTVQGMIVEIRDGRTIYQYIPVKKTAEKAVIPEKMASSIPTVQQELQAMATLPKEAKKIGSVTVAGTKCDIYQLSEKGTTVKAYMSTDKRFPVPLKMELKSGKTSQLTETTALKLNYNVPDTMFSVPKNVKIVERKIKETPEGQKLPSGKQ